MNVGTPIEQVDVPRHRRGFGWIFKIPRIRKTIIDLFHILYYGSDRIRGGWRDVYWMGVPVLKCPFDLWIYQEIIYALEPDKIIESGTYHGGSALYLASICDQVKNGVVVSIDLQGYERRPVHPRIIYLQGSSTDRSTIERLKELVEPLDRVLVLLDSNHEKAHVLEEIRLYSQFVTRGSYLVVEDTNINGHPVYRDFGPGPMEAIQEFLCQSDQFVIDKTWEKFALTFNPNGYLKRVK